MLRKIKNLAGQHGKSILISTHILHDVRTVCENVVIMSQGQIRLVDSLENLSRPARSGMLVQVDHRSQRTPEDPFPDASRLVRELCEYHVDAEVQDKGSIWVSGIDQADCRVVWQAAASAGVFVLQLSKARNSLEEIFFRTVKEAENATA